MSRDPEARASTASALAPRVTRNSTTQSGPRSGTVPPSAASSRDRVTRVPLTSSKLALRQPAPEWDLVPLIAAAVAGALLGSGHPRHIPLTLLVVWVAGGVIAVRCLALPRWALTFVILPCFVGLLAWSSMVRAQHGAAVHPLAAQVDARASGEIIAVVANDPRPSKWGVSILVRAERFIPDGLPGLLRDGATAPASSPPGLTAPSGRPDVVGARSSMDAGARTYLVEAGRSQRSVLLAAIPGDRVHIKGRLSPLSGQDRRWQTRHAVGAFQAGEIVAIDTEQGGWRAPAEFVRRWVLGGTRWLPAPDSGLLAGFLVGDTRVLDERVDADFKASGLTHLLAVSGSNVAFVLALTDGLRRRLSRRGDAVCALVIVAVFAVITRAEPSVMRASVMASIAVLTELRGQRGSGRRALAWTIVVLLVADPYLVKSVGFMLSAAASAGILWWSRGIVERVPGPAWVAEGLGVTAAAQLATAPVMLTVFGDLPLVSLLSNLAAGPLAELLTTMGIVCGIAGTALSGPLPAVAGFLQLPVLVLTMSIRWIAATSARVPLAISARPALLMVAVAWSLFKVLTRRRRQAQVGRVLESLTNDGLR